MLMHIVQQFPRADAKVFRFLIPRNPEGSLHVSTVTAKFLFCAVTRASPSCFNIQDFKTHLKEDQFVSTCGNLPCKCQKCRRPCCPANLFLGSAIGTPSPPPTDAPACVLRLTGHGLRCLQRFHEKHSFTAFEAEAA